jgi:hypothetical protein
VALSTDTAIGVDAGATLVKVATRSPAGEMSYRLAPATALSEVVGMIEAARPDTVGLTGGGAAQLGATERPSCFRTPQWAPPDGTCWSHWVREPP